MLFKMEMKFITSSLILSIVVTAQAGIPGLGGCPDKRAMPGFDMDKYLGTWYEIERYPNMLEAGTRCARTNYTKAADGRILVSNEYTTKILGTINVINGEIISVPKVAGESKIIVTYKRFPFPSHAEYIILDTDYDSYSVVWTCSSIGIAHVETAWLMTRERIPSVTVLQKAYEAMDRQRVSRKFVVKAHQEDCIGTTAKDMTITIGTRHKEHSGTREGNVPWSVLVPKLTFGVKYVRNNIAAAFAIGKVQ